MLKFSSSSSEFQALSGVEERQAPLICFSHLRWDFVFQRPQHLMVRFAHRRDVIFFEEATLGHPTISLDVRACPTTGVLVATPRLPDGLEGACRDAVIRQLLDEMIAERPLIRPVLWYYTPMMVPLSRHLDASAIVYDCMDELANFKFASPDLGRLESELLAMADIVFTGGHSLYEAKKHLHPRMYPFPSSVDRDHFAEARLPSLTPADQQDIPGPRLGYVGVIDERLDLELVAALADARPDWSVIMIGPVVKISEADLPRRANIHYLGGKSYNVLPNYLAGWDVALMPFALNESTRFISPTKTPEYLSAGRPVVSTAVTDVIRHYANLDGVVVADTTADFIAGCDQALVLARDPGGEWREAVDAHLAQSSWDQTFLRMNALIDQSARMRPPSPPPVTREAPLIRRRGFMSGAPAYDVLVVGAGFAGAVMAERLAADAGKRVLVVDKRPHIGGNAYDRLDAAGILVHQYGPHIFHTNSVEVSDYLSRFTSWRPYEHRVLAAVGDMHVPIPINRTTLNTLYGLNLSDDAAALAFLESRAEPVTRIETSEDVVVNAVGRELYETFFRGYTRKQWGLDPSQLDKSVTARIPTRTGTDDRYFTDTFQAMPTDGYTRMFERMLDHPLIEVSTGTDYRDVSDEIAFDHLVFTGPIDEFFDCCFGPLPYRSLEFRHETHATPQFQAVGTVNYPSEAIPHTRITEFKHLTGQTHSLTSIMYEYPRANGDPYYPVPRPENNALYKRYEALACARADVSFIGRLASYRYYNMDQVVGQALATYRKLGLSRNTAIDQTFKAATVR